MPKNVMKLVKPSPHRARNDFDMSHRHVLSANFGELLPVTTIETVPGDHITMHASNLLRAIPMVTSPFLRAKQHIDVWFVPYTDLWHNFNQFMTQKTEPVSSALQGSSYLPWANLFKLRNDGLDPTAVDIVGRAHNPGAERILNLLGYGYAKIGSSSTTPSVNLFRLAAYNYIWYNEYRQQYYDDGTRLLPNNTSPACLFNFDNLACDTLANAEVSDSYYLAMCQMRYRCWKKDLFTGLMPSTQFGAVSTLSSNIITTLGDLPLSNDPTNRNIIPTQNRPSGELTFTNQDNSPISYTTPYVPVDMLALRRSEAVQIWRENALRSGNRVKDNMMAHYGVASDFQDHRPTYLGSVSAPLNIGDVMTTANSDYSGNTNPNTNVGDVAGKGLSSLDEKVFTFDSKEFGVIMAIASILPEAEYNAEGISRPNQLLEAEDFFIPEYENLGLEAVSSLTFKDVVTNVAKVVGYAPRYWGYKTKLDKCYDIFRSGQLNAPWCSPKYDVTNVMTTPSGVLPLTTLYVNPKIFDVNFAVGVDVSPQFLCDYYFDVDAVRPMSVVGLPFS